MLKTMQKRPIATTNDMVIEAKETLKSKNKIVGNENNIDEDEEVSSV